MNIQQLEYIVAVERLGSFSKAAEACFVTQPTLSMMVQKLEEELNLTLFDRSKQPIIVTDAGRAILSQAKKILQESAVLKQIATDNLKEVTGELRIGIIPTLAPYLLPLFLKGFLQNFPSAKLVISEHTTENIIKGLTENTIDVGILATPLNHTGLKEQPLFYERFLAYIADETLATKKKYLLAGDIDVDNLWLLEEGHCLRSQILNLCELRKAGEHKVNLEYEAGSIESLLNIVDINNGITIIPELAALHFNKKRKSNLKEFKAPVPVREVSLVTYRHFVKHKLLEALKKEIISGVKGVITQTGKKEVVEI